MSAYSETALQWQGVEPFPHRYAGAGFHTGRHEIGHIHGDRPIDIPFPNRNRDEVIEQSLAELHHILPYSGWICRYLRPPDEIQPSAVLLKGAYDLGLQQKNPPKSNP